MAWGDCKVCEFIDRVEIDTALLNKTASLRALAAKVGCSATTIRTHRDKHLSGDVKKAIATLKEEKAKADENYRVKSIVNLLESLEGVMDKVAIVLDESFDDLRATPDVDPDGDIAHQVAMLARQRGITRRDFIMCARELGGLVGKYGDLLKFVVENKAPTGDDEPLPARVEELLKVVGESG